MGELPLDDPRWCPMQAAIELRQQQTGNLSLAIVELDRGLASGELRSMRRNIASGKAESLLAAFWTTKLGIESVSFGRGPRLYALPEPPRIVFRPTSAHEAAGRVEGWMYYVWKPDLDGRPQRKTKSKRKPGDVGRGRPPAFDPDQQKWLQERYRLDVEANPRLAKKLRDVAVPHVQQLAKTRYGIVAGRDVVLEDVIRPALKRKNAR